MTSEPAERDPEAFPFTTPTGSDARMFIQWNGTEVCLDFWCQCGVTGHYDGGFAYFLHCPGCDAEYQLGTQVIAKLVPEDQRGGMSVQTLDVDP